MVHSAVAAFLVGMASASPITDVWLINYKKGNCDEVTAFGVSGNLNENTKGDDIRLCAGRGGGKPITDLKVFKADHSIPHCGSGWSKVNGKNGANGDLNQGSHGKYETLCQRSEDDKAPIVDLQLQDKPDCDRGWHLVSSAGSSDAPDINEHGHHNGKRVYLCYQLACSVTDIVGYWAPKFSVSKKDPIEIKEQSDFSQTKVSTKTVTDSITHSRTRVKNYGTKIKTRINTHTNTWSKTVSTTISLHTSITHNHTFKHKGYAWQWVTDVYTTCGDPMRIETGEVVLSESRDQEPCCYPGTAKDQENAAVCRDKADLLCGHNDDCTEDPACKVKNSGEMDKFQTNDAGFVGNATSLMV